jgi:diguanylate cyclase (GGDEF)-like protein
MNTSFFPARHERRLILFGAALLAAIATAIGILIYKQTVALYQQQQVRQADILAENTALSIQATLERHQQLLKAFAQEHQAQLQQLVANPDNTALLNSLRQLLQTYMSGLFGLSIVDGRTAQFIIQDDIFEGYIDGVCIKDTETLIQVGKHPIKVHPNPIRYHYDMTVPLRLADSPYYLFASYSLTPFIHLLKTHQIPGHTLYILTETPKGWQIEITAEGSRQQLFQNGKPIFLSSTDLKHASLRPINGTSWVVADVLNEAMLQAFIQQTRVHLWTLWGLTIAAILIFTIMLLRRMHHIEAQQAQLNSALHELEKKNELLARQANTDGLTGLANRRAFDAALIREWHRGARNQTPLSLIMLDIDHFKRWNDTLGHLAGDDILRSVAATVRQQVKRHADMVARYGGEEIAVLLPETPHDAACALAERIRQAVEALHRKNTAVPNGHLTVSLGVCTCIPNPDLPPDPTLIACADEALYRAKQGGRNRVECNHMSRCQGTELTSTAQSE